jgi:hypothetical protein
METDVMRVPAGMSIEFMHTDCPVCGSDFRVTSTDVEGDTAKAYQLVKAHVIDTHNKDYDALIAAWQDEVWSNLADRIWSRYR